MTTTEDYVRRNIPRTLPVQLDDEETLEIARAKSKKEIAIAKMKADLENETHRRKAAIKEQIDLVETMTTEVATGKQLREVKTDELWVSGQIHVIRQDTGDVVEKRSPTMLEQQRRIPVASNADPFAAKSVLDQAKQKQAASADETEDDEEDEDDGDSTASKRAKPAKAKP